MSEYQLLSQDEQDDIIISFMLSQERDKFCHELNLQRYTEMLKTLPTGQWRDWVSKLKGETESRLAEVNGIIAVTKIQMPSTERIAAAQQRLATE